MRDIFPWLIGFGLLVIIPVFALWTEHKQKLASIHLKQLPNNELEQRIKALEQRFDKQEQQMAELKEMLYVNILKNESNGTIESRISDNNQTTRQ